MKELVLAAETCVGKLLRGDTAATLRAEGAFAVKSIVHIHDLALAVSRNGHAAAHVDYDQVEVTVLLSGLPGIHLSDGLMVQGMEDGYPGKHRMTADTGHVTELVHHHRVRDIRLAALDSGSQLVGDDAAEVAGVLAVAG